MNTSAAKIPSSATAAAFTEGVRCLVLILTVAALSALDEQIVGDPRGVAFADRQLDLHWRALFEPFPRHPQRHLIALSKDPRYASLLAARLLYRGDPWTRRGDESGITASEWRRRSQHVLVTALRELRLRDDAGLERVDIALLSRDGDPELATAALVDLLRRQPAHAKAGALRIAVPDHAEALPAAQSEEARRWARALLVETWGCGDGDTRLALQRGLASRSRSERNACLTLIPRGSGDDLILSRLGDLIAACRIDQPNALDFDALALACERLSRIDPALMPAVTDTIISARREAVGALCDLLIRLHPDPMTLPIDAIAAAAKADTDGTRRHHRLRLLLRLSPTSVATATDGDQDPWRRLAEHRAALSRWR